MHAMSKDSDAAHGPGRGKLDVTSLEGFSYLLGPPSPAQRSTLLSDIAVARPLLAGAVKSLPTAPSPEAPTAQPHPVWNESLAPDRPELSIDDNPYIPSGYTYFLQFVAHDLVQTTVPFWAAVDSRIPSANARTNSLRLDTLYGAGPSVCPVAYETAGDGPDDRTLLRLGHFNLIGTGASFPPSRCQFRDLGRINLLFDAPEIPNPRDSANFPNANEVLVADRRNDDNIILAQITVLFAMVHNVVANRVTAPYPEAKFAHARAVLQHVYYNIIAGDLLPRLLHGQVHAAIKNRAADDSRWLWRSGEIPLEFTHGAFRVGHAMVRNRYRLNTAALDKVGIVHVVHGNRSIADAHAPMQASWIVQWSQFFSDLGATPNFSRRIGPTQSRLNHDRLFPNRPDKDLGGIWIRDFLSATLAQMWTVDALIEEVQARSPGLIPESWPLLDEGRRKRAIRRWLTDVPRHASDRESALSADAIEALSADVPLPLFILLEAALDPEVRGRSLGVLGSVIVGEVIGKCLADEGRRLEGRLTDARAALADDEFWSQIDGIRSMPDLVKFAAGNGFRGDTTSPPFI